MGVINMAHGEMMMLGAYTTFVVQDCSARICRVRLLADRGAAARLSGGRAGRHRHRALGDPLSLRPAAGDAAGDLGHQPDPAAGGARSSARLNREVGNPSWMWARSTARAEAHLQPLWIIVFASRCLLLLLALQRTASAWRCAPSRRTADGEGDGHSHPRVDALTFGLGSGIAGMAGVALSQIDQRRSPTSGRPTSSTRSWSWCSAASATCGAPGGALTLGVANKLLEPVAGAVLGKILILVFIILFIQKRPRGLFAQQGPRGGGMTHELMRFPRLATLRSRRASLLAVAGRPPSACRCSTCWLPPDLALHVPTYRHAARQIPLLRAAGLSIDLVWGYCGILSLGHGAFFALGGYCMGMYLMRQIGTRGVYGHPGPAGLHGVPELEGAALVLAWLRPCSGSRR
jgi:branched-subunit amino acid ABC-type transport system permease component